ncbi:MAG: hypothetical protein U1E59_20295 [Amaricoccus sp.]
MPRRPTLDEAIARIEQLEAASLDLLTRLQRIEAAGRDRRLAQAIGEIAPNGMPRVLDKIEGPLEP